MAKRHGSLHRRSPNPTTAKPARPLRADANDFLQAQIDGLRRGLDEVRARIDQLHETLARSDDLAIKR